MKFIFLKYILLLKISLFTLPRQFTIIQLPSFSMSIALLIKYFHNGNKANTLETIAPLVKSSTPGRLALSSPLKMNTITSEAKRVFLNVYTTGCHNEFLTTLKIPLSTMPLQELITLKSEKMSSYKIEYTAFVTKFTLDDPKTNSKKNKKNHNENLKSGHPNAYLNSMVMSKLQSSVPTSPYTSVPESSTYSPSSYNIYTSTTPTSPYTKAQEASETNPYLTAQPTSPYSQPSYGTDQGNNNISSYSNPYNSSPYIYDDHTATSKKDKQDLPPSYDYIVNTNDTNPNSPVDAPIQPPAGYVPILQPAPLQGQPQESPSPSFPISTPPSQLPQNETPAPSSIAIDIREELLLLQQQVEGQYALQALNIDSKGANLAPPTTTPSDNTTTTTTTTITTTTPNNQEGRRHLSYGEQVCLPGLRSNFLSMTIGSNLNAAWFIFTACVWLYYGVKYDHDRCLGTGTSFHSFHIKAGYYALIMGFINIIVGFIFPIIFSCRLRRKPYAMSAWCKTWMIVTLLIHTSLCGISISSMIQIFGNNTFTCPYITDKAMLGIINTSYFLAFLVSVGGIWYLWFQSHFDEQTETSERILSLDHVYLMNIPVYIVAFTAACIALVLAILYATLCTGGNNGRSGSTRRRRRRF